MIKTNELLSKTLSEQNNGKYNHNKCAEELLELATNLVQRVNKPSKVSNKKIIEEIGDVRVRLAILEEVYSKKKIQQRIDKKSNQLLKYLKLKKYKNKV